jgi:hypothetical protein
MNVASPLAALVTQNSNNQNGVRPRDFMSNNKIQIRLQNDFAQSYPGVYFYEIKRGEQTQPGEIISNETAGLYLMSFDLKEPWATHRKYQVFEDKHTDLFGRPEVTADRIVLCFEAARCIVDVAENLNNKLFAKYALSVYMLMYILRLILEEDPKGQEAIKDPAAFVRDAKNRDAFRTAVTRCMHDVVVDLNAELDELGADFDYRNRLRDADWVKSLSRTIVSSYLKLLKRGRIESFGADYQRAAAVV